MPKHVLMHNHPPYLSISPCLSITPMPNHLPCTSTPVSKHAPHTHHSHCTSTPRPAHLPCPSIPHTQAHPCPSIPPTLEQALGPRTPLARASLPENGKTPARAPRAPARRAPLCQAVEQEVPRSPQADGAPGADAQRLPHRPSASSPAAARHPPRHPTGSSPDGRGATASRCPVPPRPAFRDPSSLQRTRPVLRHLPTPLPPALSPALALGPGTFSLPSSSSSSPPIRAATELSITTSLMEQAG